MRVLLMTVRVGRHVEGVGMGCTVMMRTACGGVAAGTSVALLFCT